MRPVLSIGEPLIAAVPTMPVTLDAAELVRLFPGGAEVNVSVGLARLGVPCSYVGFVGDDPLGRIIVQRLVKEGVDTLLLRTGELPTGLYFREWLADGQRRPYYYRKGAVGAQLSIHDVPASLDAFALVHLTGITPALGDGPRHAVEEVVRRSSLARVPVSLDVNFRPALWSAEDCLDWVTPLMSSLSVLFVGEEEAELLFSTSDPDRALERGRRAGVRTCVVRLGEQGACARGEDNVTVECSEPAAALDPVGAGDAFDAGFLAGWLSRAPLRDCVALGVYCGARVVEVLGEHEGAPRRDSLPIKLRMSLS